MTYPYQSQAVELDNSWPGLEFDGGVIEVDPETLRGIARQLRGELSRPATGNPAALEARLSMEAPTGWFGRWPTGGYMEHGLQTAGGSIAHNFRKVLEQVDAAAVLFDATAEDYERADGSQGSRLEAAAGWDRIAVDSDRTTLPAASWYRDSTRVPFVSQYENVDDYPADWIEERLAEIRNGQTWNRLDDAGRSLEDSAARLSDIVGMLRARAATLSDQWSSETSVACQRALQRIAGTARELSTAAGRVAEFAHRSAEAARNAALGYSDERSLLEQAHDLVAFRSDPNREQQARDALASLNETYRQINYSSLPGYVNADLPQLPAPKDSLFRNSGGAAHQGFVSPPPGGYPPPATVPTPSGSPTADSVDYSAGFGSAVPAGLVTSGDPGTVTREPLGGPELTSGGLAGAAVPSTATPGGSLGHLGSTGQNIAGGIPNAGAGAGAVGAGGTGIVPGAAGPSGMVGNNTAGGGARGDTGSRRGTPGGVYAMGAQGSGGGPRSGTGSRSAAPGDMSSRTGAAGGTSASATTRPGAPGGMMPVSGNARDDDREKGTRADSWLTEDEDPWRGNEDVPPPVIR